MSDQSYSPPQQILRPVHSNGFIYRPPGDYCQYYVYCKRISGDLLMQLLNDIRLLNENVQCKEDEYTFFYRQQCDLQIYQISCKIVSPSLINDCLNKNIYGIEMERNMQQENLVFTLDQEKNLEFHLSQYLSNYFLLN